MKQRRHLDAVRQERQALPSSEPVPSKGHSGSTAGARGSLLWLRADLIDEDPLQPRTQDNPGFSKRSMTELTASIRLRGIKTPVSVRPHAVQAGRYVINHGARRLRAARMAGLVEIPAFIDHDYSEADQVVENLQRNELTPREIADFIGRELAKGRRKGEIARMISKSPSYVSQHAVLLDLPEAVAQAFTAGRVRDVTLINELLAAFKHDPGAVTRWLGDEQQDITRGSVRMLRAFLSESLPGSAKMFAGPADEVQTKTQIAIPLSSGFHGVLVVAVDGREAFLQTRRRPSSASAVWVQFSDDRSFAEVAVSALRIIGLAPARSR